VQKFEQGYSKPRVSCCSESLMCALWVLDGLYDVCGRHHPPKPVKPQANRTRPLPLFGNTCRQWTGLRPRMLPFRLQRELIAPKISQDQMLNICTVLSESFSDAITVGIAEPSGLLSLVIRRRVAFTRLIHRSYTCNYSRWLHSSSPHLFSNTR
jgi:hypothetical protein